MNIVRRYIAVILLGSVSFIYADIKGDIRIGAIRVEFQVDDSPGTSGNGTFLTSNDTIFCGKYTIDPPPHNRDYFLAQLHAIDNYYTRVSHGQLTVDIVQSNVFPSGSMDTYVLPNTMDYYQPYGEEDIHEERITHLFKDAVQIAFDTDGIDFSQFDLIVVFHAGVGQDFALPFLDPTPEDIPSTFVDNDMIQTHLGVPAISLGQSSIAKGIILPETQNHLLFDDLESSFGTDFSSCDYQFGLTGTFALMMGFALGLPPLWDIESGESGIGVFGLMDQGSNNGRGMVPAPPDAWTRYFAGWETPEIDSLGETVHIVRRDSGNSHLVNVDGDEYYLIENRINHFRPGVSIDSLRYRIWEETDEYPAYVKVLFDSVNIEFDSTGVVTNIPGYDIGLPNSGLLIWHIDENIIQGGIEDYKINANPSNRGVDLVEADGAKDIGFPSIFPFNDPSAGYFADMWYKGNGEYVRFNPDKKGDYPEFGPYTIPNTQNNEGSATYIRIDSISTASDTMFYVVRNAFIPPGFPVDSKVIEFQTDIDSDGNIDFLVVEGDLTITDDPLKAGQAFHQFSSITFDVVLTGLSQIHKSIGIVETIMDSLRMSVYSFPGGTPVLDWNKTIKDPGLISISGSNNDPFIVVYTENEKITCDGSSIEIEAFNGYKTIQSTVTIENSDVHNTASIDNTGKLSINGNDVESTAQFKNVAAVDLDLDRDIEFVAITYDNKLYGFHENGTFVAGFPESIENAETFLLGNLIGDEHPEIVVQNSDFDLIVYNWKGELQYFLGNPENSPLIQLGVYKEKHAIWTSDAVWIFDALDESTLQNSWSFSGQNPGRTNKLVLTFDTSIASGESLMDKSRTYAYPNPSENGAVKIRVENGIADHLSCEIFDIAGYFVKKLTMENPVVHEPNEILWNVEGMEPGIYFAKVTATNGSKSDSKILRIGIIE